MNPAVNGPGFLTMIDKMILVIIKKFLKQNVQLVNQTNCVNLKKNFIILFSISSYEHLIYHCCFNNNI